MAKKESKKEVSIIWDFLSCAILYGLICYFNGPDKQQEISQEAVQKFAMIAAVVWFFMYIIIMSKSGSKVVLFKHKTKKEDKKKSGKKAAAESGTKTGRKSPETIILRDPSTGAERLFTKDDDGQWVSEDGGSVLDSDAVSEWTNQRRRDRSWQREANEQINSGSSAMDKKLKSMDEDTAKNNAQLDEELKNTLKRIEKYGTTDDDVEHLKEIIRRQQELDEIEGNRSRREGNLADIGYKGASAAKYGADKAFDVIGNTGGTAGKVGKAVYTALTDQAGAISEAVAEGQDAWTASKKAALDTVVSVAEDNLSGGAKYVGTVGGEGVREMGKAMIDGKEGLSAVKSGMEGAVKGMYKANAEVVGENLGGLFEGGGSEMIKDAGGNIKKVIVDDKDIISAATQDSANYVYDSFAEDVGKMKKKNYRK